MYIRAVSVRPILVVGYRMELYISKLHCIVDQSVIQSPEVAVTCTHVVVTANAVWPFLCALCVASRPSV